MWPDPKQEYIAEIEAWENLPLPVRIRTPKPVLKAPILESGGGSK